MILLLVFGPRPQWLMNFARSLLKLTRGETLILSLIVFLEGTVTNLAI